MARGAHERAKRYQAAVSRILLDEWDPIGVRGIPQAVGEYTAYAAGVASLLMRDEPKEKLIDYLWTIETENMGLDGNRPRIELVVARLLQLRHEIDGHH